MSCSWKFNVTSYLPKPTKLISTRFVWLRPKISSSLKRLVTVMQILTHGPTTPVCTCSVVQIGPLPLPLPAPSWSARASLPCHTIDLSGLAPELAPNMVRDSIALPGEKTSSPLDMDT